MQFLYQILLLVNGEKFHNSQESVSEYLSILEPSNSCELLESSPRLLENKTMVSDNLKVAKQVSTRLLTEIATELGNKLFCLVKQQIADALFHYLLDTLGKFTNINLPGLLLFFRFVASKENKTSTPSGKQKVPQSTTRTSIREPFPFSFWDLVEFLSENPSVGLGLLNFLLLKKVPSSWVQAFYMVLQMAASSRKKSKH